jgi:hypothetical protein
MFPTEQGQAPDLLLPLTLLSRYLFFLGRRPISTSNTGFLTKRIHALQTLVPLLQNRDDQQLDAIASRLVELTPANLFRHSSAIQHALKKRVAKNLPRDIVVGRECPPQDFWRPIRRCLLVLAPGIGIGDEIITFAIPSCLHRLVPDMEITVLSMYPGLWDGIAHIKTVLNYHTAAELVSALRNSGDYDLVFLADFEPPGLMPAICGEPAVTRYMELSLGTRSLSCLDNTCRELFQMPVLESYNVNFYECLHHMMSWLGVPGRLPHRHSLDGTFRAVRDVPKNFVIVVSPFTSKEDPSERYWSQLLAGMLPAEISRPVRIMIDTGASSASESFAVALSRSARTQHPNVNCQVARCRTGRNVPLDEMMCCFRSADPAHAAPLFGCLTLVIASKGVENWRVPSPASFYLPMEASAARVAATIRAILREFAPTPHNKCAFTPRSSRECLRLRQVSLDVEEALQSQTSWSELHTLWNRFSGCYAELLASLHHWPEPYSMLFSDQDYQKLWIPFPKRDTDLSRIHLQNRFRDWLSSNLHKYAAFETTTRQGEEL